MTSCYECLNLGDTEPRPAISQGLCLIHLAMEGDDQ